MLKEITGRRAPDQENMGENDTETGHPPKSELLRLGNCILATTSAGNI